MHVANALVYRYFEHKSADRARASYPHRLQVQISGNKVDDEETPVGSSSPPSCRGEAPKVGTTWVRDTTLRQLDLPFGVLTRCDALEVGEAQALFVTPN